jgi:DNA invertase Pin-like site-specific DNA recombinase
LKKETAFADLSQKVGTNEMFKYINEHPEYNTILTTEISRIGRRQSILHSIKEHCLAKQIQIYIKDLDFKLLDDNGKVNQQGELYSPCLDCSLNQEKTKLERFVRKRKEQW